MDDDFYDLGGSSLQAFTIFARISDLFGTDLPPTLMMQCSTIATQAELLHNVKPHAGEKLVPFRRSGGGLPLFVVHGVFGDIMFTREIVRDLKSDRPVYGLQPAPLDGAHKLPRTMETIAAGYLAEIRKVQPKGPYFLAGYSFGGMAALEMAQQLAHAGEPVAFVGLIDTIYDGRYQVAGESTTARVERHWKQIRSRHAPVYFAKGLATTLAHFARSVGESLAEIPNELRYKLGGPIPYEKRARFYRLMFLRASQRYRLQPYRGPLTMFSAQGMTERHRERWNNIAGGGLMIHEIPADHFNLVWPPHSTLLAECFDAGLDNAVVG
jgi:acetoacetyl-CoA synthetase